MGGGVLLLYLLVLVVSLTNANFDLAGNFEQASNEKSWKLFPFFSIVRISNKPCLPEAAKSAGTCFTNSQCRSAGGVASGACANGFGVCCVVTKTCGSISGSNNTNFRSRDYPSEFTPDGLEICSVRIQRPSTEVCQVRLDFEQMKLAPADKTTGECIADKLHISGVSVPGSVPGNLCGDLSDQHLYLEYGSSDRITLRVETDGSADTRARAWNVMISYIKCNSLLRAPDGCLQYFARSTGELRMLGYPMAPHLANLDYTVCIRPEEGMGSILWSTCPAEPENSRFILTGSITTAQALSECGTDYVVIMTDNRQVSSGTQFSDRFCGTRLLTPPLAEQIRSSVKPFIMRVKTDADEADNTASTDPHTGFCLTYRQEPSR